MINKKAISLNILFSLMQIFVTGLAYYFLYKYLLQHIGTDMMGVWAIVLSVSSTANIANLGIGSSVVRYTAKFMVNAEPKSIIKLIHTALLFLGVVFLIICAIIYLIAPFWLHAVIKANYYNAAMNLIPYSLFCLILNALSGIFVSCIDGLQKNYVRSIIYIISFMVLLSCCYWLVPRYGLVGVAYAQVIQSAFLLLSAALSLKFIFKPLQFFPLAWDKAIFKKIFSFGIQEQVISICQLCFDPFTKSILAGFGNLGMVTYYEMANRLVTQVRGFLVSANQVFIPVFTSTNEKSEESTHHLYKKVFSINFLLSVLCLALIIASVIPISKIWINQLNKEFTVISILLALAYWWNIVMSPAYFANMGGAALKDNVVGNIIIAIFNIVLCIGLGYFFKGYGVVVGWSLALAIGSGYIVCRYHKKNRFSITRILSRKDLGIAALSILYCVLCLSFFYFNNNLNVWVMFAIDIFLFVILCTVAYFIHPVGSFFLETFRRATQSPKAR